MLRSTWYKFVEWQEVQMLFSLEVRWFVPGTVPVEVKAWFGSEGLGGELGTQEAREDVYLLPEGREDLGIKLRQSNFEVKWRKTSFGVQAFGNWEASVEEWIKWSCQTETEAEFIAEAIASGKWLSVHKVRQQRRYPQFNCAVELAQVTVRSQSWWSFNIEASGKTNQLRDNLEQVLKQVQKRDRPFNGFAANNSYAYPHFLAILTNR